MYFYRSFELSSVSLDTIIDLSVILTESTGGSGVHTTGTEIRRSNTSVRLYVSDIVNNLSPPRTDWPVALVRGYSLPDRSIQSPRPDESARPLVGAVSTALGRADLSTITIVVRMATSQIPQIPLQQPFCLFRLYV